MNERVKNNRGFTLLEMVIAIFLLTIVILPILEIFGGSLRITQKSKEEFFLNAVARQIKRDVYIAYREGTELIKFDGTPNGTPQLPPPTNGGITTGFAIISNYTGNINPQYRYSITPKPDIFYTTGNAIELGENHEIRCLVEIYQADGASNFTPDPDRVDRSFFMNIPLKFL